GVHAAREPHDPLLEAAAHHDLVLEEAHEPAARELGIDGERVSFLHPLPHYVDARCGMRDARCVGPIHRWVELDRPSLTLPASRIPHPEILDEMRQVDLQI